MHSCLGDYNNYHTNSIQSIRFHYISAIQSSNFLIWIKYFLLILRRLAVDCRIIKLNAKCGRAIKPDRID